MQFKTKMNCIQFSSKNIGLGREGIFEYMRRDDVKPAQERDLEPPVEIWVLEE